MRGYGQPRLIGTATTVSILLLLLSTTGIAEGATRTVGVASDDKFVYNYTIFTTFATPNGNKSSSEDNMFTLGVVSTNTEAPLGEVIYSEEITEVNDTFASTPSAIENTTAIFDPYDNYTYLGNIGFYPFTYTDLSIGSANDLPVSLTITGTPEGDVTGPQQVNTTVARTAGTLDVNFTIFSGGGIPPSQTVLKYNATNGVLMQGATYTHFFSVEKNFIYNLVSSASAPKGILNSSVQIFVITGLIFVFAFVAVWRVTRSREKRRFAKARQKMGR